ncbi:hypothetical protein DCS32_12470 [Dokdonia sp. Dokd-P16]|uniref:hypothetical protein n=1 Tax=Dokdonia sp. Dokd-P16 TaxID=2173169 RepID=UPI000D5460AF|nr:hypothetical protein [Dokdonia sp. Dokd-P16]AWH74947.1 hypothetical protein DCS32_12470 [Dokdonia sp. Dokd-P16]
MKFITTALLGALLLCSIPSFGQVGINTTSPASTLDITASNEALPSNTDGILIPRVQAFPVIDPTADQDGILVFLNTTDGTDNRGFYYWDHSQTRWVGFADEWRDGMNASGDDLIFASQASTTGTQIVITDDGRIGFGTEDPIERFEFRGPGDNDFQITSANSNPPNVIVYNSGGTLDAPTALPLDQEVGSFIAKTHDNNVVQEIGGLRFYMDDTGSPGSVPTRFELDLASETNTSREKRLIVKSTGNTGLSEANPTATLHIRPGTTAAQSAPIKFSQGNIMNTPEAGALEYSGTNLYFTDNTGTRNIVNVGRSIDSPSITETVNPQSTFDSGDITVTGARVGMTCNCTPQTLPSIGLMWNCFITGDDTVRIRIANVTNAAIDTDGLIFTVKTIK